MEKKELMDRANRFYPDGFLQEYLDEQGDYCPKTHGGDGLANFIASELDETFDSDASDEDQLSEAKRVMHTALGDILAVIAGLDDCVNWRGLTKTE